MEGGSRGVFQSTISKLALTENVEKHEEILSVVGSGPEI